MANTTRWGTRAHLSLDNFTGLMIRELKISGLVTYLSPPDIVPSPGNRATTAGDIGNPQSKKRNTNYQVL